MSPRILLGISLLPASVAAQVMTVVSVTPSGRPGNGASGGSGVAVSGNGRYVAFGSDASDLVPGDSNGVPDIFVRDRLTNTTERVSVSTAGAEANGRSDHPAISADGRYVAFVSRATNLVAGDDNGTDDVFWHDRQTRVTGAASAMVDGARLRFGNGASFDAAISADGRFVAFKTFANNWADPDRNGFGDIYVRDLTGAGPVRVSLSSTNAEADGDNNRPQISADGRYVVWYSNARNLAADDNNGTDDVFRRDRMTGTTELVSRRHPSFGAGSGNAASLEPSVSADGRLVAFDSFATDLVVADTNGARDAFVRDMAAGMSRVSVSSLGREANADSVRPRLSADGRHVVFSSAANNLVPADANGWDDVFVHDRALGTTTLESRNADGVPGNSWSAYPEVSADGAVVAFFSNAYNLLPGVGINQVYARHWRVPAGFSTFGTGCGSPAPVIGSNGLPILGRPYGTTLGWARPNAPAVLVIGASDRVWHGLQLPLSLATLGAPGCWLLVSVDVQLPVSVDGNGQGEFRWPINTAVKTLGGVLFQQFAVLDPTANPLGLSFTAAARAQIGNTSD